MSVVAFIQSSFTFFLSNIFYRLFLEQRKILRYWGHEKICIIETINWMHSLLHRILHFYSNRKIDVNDMRCCLAQNMSKRQLEAMMLYFLKHNQRVVSKELGISQSAVSARLKQGLKKLKRKIKTDERAAKYYAVFDNLTKQKSLYSSQTRMKVVTQVDNYAQFNSESEDESDNRDQPIAMPSVQAQPIKIKSKIKRLNIVKLVPSRRKKIKFNRSKLKKLRLFFKR